MLYNNKKPKSENIILNKILTRNAVIRKMTKGEDAEFRKIIINKILDCQLGSCVMQIESN